MNNKAKHLMLAAVITVLLVILDQWSKAVASATIKINGPYALWPGVFELQYLENSGAAWGMLNGQMILFVVLAVLITAAVAYVYVRMPDTKRYLPLKIVGILLVSGAIGNMIDRVTHHYVVDFFSFVLIHFPIFNVADCYVTVAAFMLVILVLFVYKEKDFAFLNRKKDGTDR